MDTPNWELKPGSGGRAHAGPTWVTEIQAKELKRGLASRSKTDQDPDSRKMLKLRIS